ncbi:MAG: FAD-binding protein [Clostridia bacterium]|nr:FAD-binding protein [Clostridia bacterium]
MRYRDFDAIAVGSGAAGFAAACRLRQNGLQRVAVVTEDVNGGTSRNTGSDKQTYYKLSLAGEADSVEEMAKDLFACGCMDGDTALAEAACSARCFLYLAELGVPFPYTPYGEYAGYKTDHDPRARASSAGPLTSKYMTEALEKEAARLGVAVLDHLYVTDILQDEHGVCGVAAVHTETGEMQSFCARSVILATGGPAGIYAHSVYPACHTGSTSPAIRAGAALQNLTEWQYGLACVTPRWNVSGSYMQVLPRFLSVDAHGNTYEFLTDYFGSVSDALEAVFLKGYQWPFDAAKAKNGSSRVDLAVHTERVKKNRRVYLDFTGNPFGIENIIDAPLSAEARAYLTGAGACFGTPFERLAAMNAPAAELFRGKGTDLSKERLEIALCAQHCNGGIAVDNNWQTNIPGLYAVGECAGTHGVVRPGGSALNAGQVGALRAAQHIRRTPREPVSEETFLKQAEEARERHEQLTAAVCRGNANVQTLTEEIRERFSGVCAAIRDVSRFGETKESVASLLADLPAAVRINERRQIADVYRLQDALTVQLAMLCACEDYYRAVGVSRGSAVYTENAEALCIGSAKNADADKVRQIRLENGRFEPSVRPVRPLPESDLFFENVWRDYRERNL